MRKLVVFLILALSATGIGAEGWFFMGPLPEGGSPNIGNGKIAFRALGCNCAIGEETVEKSTPGYIHQRELSCNVKGTKGSWLAVHYASPGEVNIDQDAQFQLSRGSEKIILSLRWQN